MSTKTLTARPDPKLQKLLDVATSVWLKANMDEAEKQRVNEASGLKELLEAHIAEHRLTDKYADEEVQSNYRYPQEYKGAHPIEEQIKALAAMLNLDPGPALAYQKKLPELPEGAEGYFAVISPSGISKLFPDVKDPAEAYCQMLQLVHEKITASRSFYNYREGEIDTAHLKVHPRTAEKMKVVAEQQPGDILILACQLGMRHRGRSVRRAREVFTANEFGLTSVSVGCIVLTHPERLVRYDELDMDCAGDEFSDVGDGLFDRAPVFYFNGRARFGADYVGDPGAYCGSASGFSAQ